MNGPDKDILAQALGGLDRAEAALDATRQQCETMLKGRTVRPTHLVYLAGADLDVTDTARLWLVDRGYVVFDPTRNNPKQSDQGETEWRLNLAIIQRSDAVYVVAFDGWLDSPEILAAVEAARIRFVPVRLLQQVPNGWEVGPEVWGIIDAMARKAIQGSDRETGRNGKSHGETKQGLGTNGQRIRTDQP